MQHNHKRLLIDMKMILTELSLPFFKCNFNYVMKLLKSFLVAQWLGFQAFTVVARIQSLVGELRIPQALWPIGRAHV